MQNPYGKILKQITSSLEHLKFLHAQMQIKAHPLHVSRSPSFTPTIILTNAWTFIKAAAFANRSTPPEHNHSEIHLHIPPLRLQRRTGENTHMLKHMCCRDAAAPLFFWSGFSIPRLILEEVHVCVCEGERGLHYDKSHLYSGQSIKFVMGKQFVVTPPPKTTQMVRKLKTWKFISTNTPMPQIVTATSRRM